MITKMTEPCILCGDIKIPTEKQLSIEMISKITELYILCGDIQIPTEKNSLLLKWLQRWKTLTFFVGAFKVQLTEPYIFVGTIQIPVEKAVQYPNDFKDDRTLHPCGDIQIKTEKDSSVLKWSQRLQNFTSFEGRFKDEKNSLLLKWLQRWKTLTFFVGAFKVQLTEPYIFVGTIQIPVEKAVQYPNDFKDDRTLHRCGDSQIKTEKDSSVLKWSQRLQNFTSFEGRFRPQLKKTV